VTLGGQTFASNENHLQSHLRGQEIEADPNNVGDDPQNTARVSAARGRRDDANRIDACFI